MNFNRTLYIHRPQERLTIIAESKSDFSGEDNLLLLNIKIASIYKVKEKNAKVDRLIWKKGKMPANDSNNFEFKGHSELIEIIN